MKKQEALDKELFMWYNRNIEYICILCILCLLYFILLYHLL